MKYYLIPFLLLFSFSSSAQPYLDSFDIYQGQSLARSSYPANLVAYGNTLYFSAIDSAHGRELWVFFANDTSPKRLTDICADTVSSIATGNKTIGIHKGDIYFSAKDADGKYDLWLHDGNSTRKAATIGSNNNEGYPEYITSFNDKVYFTAVTDAAGRELWEYDPVTQKARMLDDIMPGSFDSRPNDLTPFNGKLYFGALGQDVGREIFSFDPISNTVALDVDINPQVGVSNSSPEKFIVVNNKLYFFAIDRMAGLELFDYDGVNAPNLLTDLEAGYNSGVAPQAGIVYYKGDLYFSGFDQNTIKFQLAKYDLSTNLPSIAHVLSSTNHANITSLAVLGDNLYYNADDGIAGQEFWKFDGNTGTLIADILTGNRGSTPAELTTAGFNLYFSGETTYFTSSYVGMGNELFRYSDFPASTPSRTNFNMPVCVYPSPTNNTVTFELNTQTTEPTHINITDLQGKLLYRSTHTVQQGIINVWVKDYPSGVYLYTISKMSGRMLSRGKFIKK